MHCDRDAQNSDILDIVAPSFEACIHSCVSERTRAHLANSTQSCDGVSFVPDWVNITLALQAGRGGNCFFKQGPLSATNLEGSYFLLGSPHVHSAIVGRV